MKREDVHTMIVNMGLPCAYYQFPDDTPKAPPFICWFFSTNTDVMADNRNYVDKEVLNVELYTKVREYDLEKAVEAALAAGGFSYAKEAAYIDDEKMYQISYESEVIIDA